MSSSRIEWIPVTIWSTSVIVQASTAIYTLWWKKSRDEEHDDDDGYFENLRKIDKALRSSEYGRILRGEKFHGWKVVRFGPDNVRASSISSVELIKPLWPKKGDDESHFDTSVLVRMIGRYPGENSALVYVIRRYSLIAPNVYDEIIRIIYDCDFDGIRSGLWSPRMQCYISEDVVAIGWRREGSDQIRIVLVHVESKSYQVIETTSPRCGADIKMIFTNRSANGRIMVLFRVDRFYELVEYELASSESHLSPTVRPATSRRLEWPHPGEWSFESWNFPGAFYLMNTWFANGTRSSRVITLDRRGFHDLGPRKEWYAEFKFTSPIGKRVVQAQESLTEILPRMGNEPIVDFELHRSHLFAHAREDTTNYVHRPLYRPSKRYRVAEEYCLANPNFDYVNVKRAIGFEVFEEFVDEKVPAVMRM